MTRKKHAARHSSSEESIENLLYYKDCKHKPIAKTSTTSARPLALRSTEAPKSDCPCPRMCCSMCCDCSIPLPQSSLTGRQMQPIQQVSSQMVPSIQALRHPIPPAQPNIDMGPPGMSMMHPKRKKLKHKIDELMMPPIGSRRGLTLTRDNIKSLINKDEDIKKILKDLVRVTMTKVDLKRRAYTPIDEGSQPEKDREDRENDKKPDDDYLEE